MILVYCKSQALLVLSNFKTYNSANTSEKSRDNETLPLSDNHVQKVVT